ncbi:MAG: pilin [Candidatus Peregrinibacteria bacterium]
MTFIRSHHWSHLAAVITGLILMFGFSSHALGAARDDFEDSLKARQQEVSAAYDRMDTRIKAMNTYDPKKEEARRLLDAARGVVDTFEDLDADDHVRGTGTPSDPFYASPLFEEIESEAMQAINAVNLHLISPDRPGAVPEGDLIHDFIPQFIRQLFRFTSVAILIAIVVSAVMMIIAFDNEEFYTKGKHMLIYSLIGFAFVVLAFALVKAVTDIDFFEFI